MADAISIQELIDARTDAKTLEEAVNGDAVTTVLSRLGESYPTLANALSQIDGKLDSADAQIKQAITDLFENGGLPATPFATKALMEASELVDGKYAVVTDDVEDNGVYIKEGGVWNNSKFNEYLQPYDLVESSNKFTKSSYKEGLIVGSPVVIQKTFGGVPDGVISIIPVESDTDYYLYSQEPDLHDRFRVVTTDTYPEYGDTGFVISSSDNIREVKFRTSETAKWVVIYVSSDGQHPKLSLTKGTERLPFTNNRVISQHSVQSLDISQINYKKGRSRNLFDGVYRNDIQLFSSSNIGTAKATVYIGKAASGSRRTIVVPIKEGRKYSVKFFSPLQVSDFCWAATSRGYPIADQVNSNHAQTVNGITKREQFDFVAGKGSTHLIIYVSSLNHEPLVNILEGDAVDYYIPPYSALSEDLQKPDIVADSVLVKSENLFNPKVVRAYVATKPNQLPEGDSHFLVSDPDLEHGKVCYITPIGYEDYVTSAYFSDREPSSAYVYKSYHYPAIVSTEEDYPTVAEGLGLSDKKIFDTSGSYQSDSYLLQQGYQIIEIDAIDKGDFTPNILTTAGLVKKEYTLPFQLDNRLLDSDYLDKKEEGHPVYNWITDLSGFYRHTSDLPKNADGSSDIRSLQGVFEDLLDLVDKSNGYLTIKEIGRADGDYPFYVIETNPTQLYQHFGQNIPEEPYPESSIPFKVPKIIISAGVHGTETGPVLSTYQMLKILSESSELDPKLLFIRRNIKLVVMPLVSPSAYRYAYHNVNDINVNRDFPPTGAASAAETQLVMQVLQDNSGADYYFDYHNTATVGALGYTICNNTELMYMGADVFAHMGKYLQDMYPSFPQDLNFRWGFNTPTVKSMAIDYAEVSLGLKSCVFELHGSLDFWWEGGTSERIEMTRRIGLELPINMIIGCARNIQHKSKNNLR